MIFLALELGFLLVEFKEGFDFVDHKGGSTDDTGALMKCMYGNIEDALSRRGCGLSSTLFDDEGHGIAFIQETELTRRIVGCIGVKKYPALEKYSMDIGYHRADVAQFEVECIAVVDVSPHRQVKFQVISLIDGIVLCLIGDADIAMGEEEFADGGIECETVDAVARSVDQYGTGTVGDVSCCNEFVARLEKVFKGDRCAGGGDSSVDTKDGAN